jgi:hypothetical protein
MNDLADGAIVLGVAVTALTLVIFVCVKSIIEIPKDRRQTNATMDVIYHMLAQGYLNPHPHEHGWAIGTRPPDTEDPIVHGIWRRVEAQRRQGDPRRGDEGRDSLPPYPDGGGG